MVVTDRDIRLLRDLVLSHVLSRDQIIRLGYFGTVTRLNTRLRELRAHGLVKVLDTPFHTQFLYMAGPRAQRVVGERLEGLALARMASPRFLRHALSVTEVRIALQAKGMTRWHFEQQVTCKFDNRGTAELLRPDGLAIGDAGPVAVEADLGNVSKEKVLAKLLTYDAFVASGNCLRMWGFESLKLLIVTTGERRKNLLRRTAKGRTSLDVRCMTFSDLGVEEVGSWS